MLVDMYLDVHINDFVFHVNLFINAIMNAKSLMKHLEKLCHVIEH